MKKSGISIVLFVAVMVFIMPASTFGAPCAALGTDTDGDGIDDKYETPDGDLDCDNDDSDGDGIANYLDTDDDGDGIPTAKEGASDTDNDGLPNYLDVDSDNDTINDLLEANGPFIVPSGSDTDQDGLDDRWDSDDGGSPAENPDSDLDGIPDMLDVDSDNDMICDSEDLDRLVPHELIADANGPYFLVDGLGLTLDGSGSFTSDGLPIRAYDWDIGNDGTIEFYSSNAILDLSAVDLSFLSFPGVYDIRLWVTDEAGFKATDSTSLNASNVPVPEPATILLIGTGLVGLAGTARKKLFKK